MKRLTGLKEYLIHDFKTSSAFEKISALIWGVLYIAASIFLTREQFNKLSIFFFVGALFIAGIIMNKLKKANEKILRQNKEIDYQRQLVEEKNKEITDSINYALRIQTAILPPDHTLAKYLKNFFILYKPKAIVSGDFYWLEKTGELILFAACDCTGHGVPGSMVSLVCNNALNRSVHECHLTKPSDILDKANEFVIETFARSENKMRDGMDISLCALNYRTNVLDWAGANNPLWLILDGEFLETKADKQAIGNNEDNHPFTNHSFTLHGGDSIIIFSDGYADQYGTNGEKKITKKRFSELIKSIQNLSMQEQKTELEKFLTNHRKGAEQTDDILVMSIRI